MLREAPHRSLIIPDKNPAARLRTPEPSSRPSPASAEAAPAALVPQGDLRLGPLSPIPALLRDLGVDPAPVLAACGLTVDVFDDPERRLPYRAAAGAFMQAAMASGREDFGLLLGQRFELRFLGLLGRLLWHAATVGEALHDLYRYFHLHDRGGVVYLRRRAGSTMALGYTIVDADTPGAALVHDLVMAIGLRLLRGVAGNGFALREVLFARAHPGDAQPYRRFFVAPLRFDATRSELRFDRVWLQRPAMGADAAGHEAVQCQAAQAAEPPSMAARARTVAHVLLAGGEVSAPAVAEALGLHERTLRRRLASEGVTLRDVIAAARFELAKQLLRDTQMPVERVAVALGYADPSAFLRAFRAWSGVTPGQWRAGQ